MTAPVLALVLAAGLAGCGDDDEEPSVTGGTGTTATTGSDGGAAATSTTSASGDTDTSATSTTEEDADEAGPVFVAEDIEWADAPDTLAPGTVEVTLDNRGALQHTLVFEGTDFRLVAAPGSEETAEVELAPGEVTFFCDVPGHAEAGMTGTLTVE